jgi:hypothetical protein
METQLVSDLVREYVDMRFKRLMAESEAQHRDPQAAEMYMLEAWKMKNIGQEITRYLVGQGL